MLPTWMLWCHIVRIASRSALTHARPVIRSPTMPMMPLATFTLPMEAMLSLSARPGRNVLIWSIRFCWASGYASMTNPVIEKASATSGKNDKNP